MLSRRNEAHSRSDLREILGEGKFSRQQSTIQRWAFMPSKFFMLNIFKTSNFPSTVRLSFSKSFCSASIQKLFNFFKKSFYLLLLWFPTWEVWRSFEVFFFFEKSLKLGGVIIISQQKYEKDEQCEIFPFSRLQTLSDSDYVHGLVIEATWASEAVAIGSVDRIIN